MPRSVDDLVSRMTTEEFETCEGGYECAICLEGEGGDTTAPLKLACGHSFCAACLRSHALAQLKQQGRYLAPCPLCKREMRMKEVACVFASADPKSRNEFVALLREVHGGGLWQEDDTATEATLATVGQRVTRDYIGPCCYTPAHCLKHSPGRALACCRAGPLSTRPPSLHTQAPARRPLSSRLSLRGLAEARLALRGLAEAHLGRGERGRPQMERQRERQSHSTPRENRPAQIRELPRPAHSTLETIAIVMGRSRYFARRRTPR